MKKNSLFKILAFVMLGYCLLTWILPGSSSLGTIGDTRMQMGLFALFQVPSEAFGAFINLFIFILLVGGFYGIMEATGVYKRLINLFASKYEGKEKTFLIAVIVLLSVISSITGLEVGMFFVFPFLVAILLRMGFDKLTVTSATLGSVIVGMFGSTFSGVLYNAGNTSFNLSMKSELLAKFVLLILGIALLVVFTLNHVKKSKFVDNKKKNDVLENKKESNKPLWPMIVVFDLIVLVLVLGTTDWASIFGSNFFSTAHDAMMNFKIGDFQIINKLFTGLSAFGTWIQPVRFQYYSIFMLIGMVVLMLVYRVNLKTGYNEFAKGVKKYFAAGLLAVIASSMFVFVFYYPAFNTIGTWIMQLSDTFNIALSGLFTLIASVFYPDYYYFTYYVLPYIGQVAASENLYPLVNVMTTSLYSLAMLIAPTSVLMLVSLATNGVSYKDWVKHIWKLFVSLLIVAFIVFLVMLLV